MNLQTFHIANHGVYLFGCHLLEISLVEKLHCFGFVDLWRVLYEKFQDVLISTHYQPYLNITIIIVAKWQFMKIKWRDYGF